MPVHVIVGTQWGDEGKGRIADLLAADADIVARYAGGDNAGHTVRVEDETFKLHLVPSGVIHSGVQCVMGNGMVINPVKLMDELVGLDDRGVDISPDRIFLSGNAHVITPGHIALDGAKESSRREVAIGTTKRGIGPAYTDKSSRSGIHTRLMRYPDRFVTAIREHIERTNRTLITHYDARPIDQDTELDSYYEAASYLKPYLTDTSLLLHEALAAKKFILGEGAQGTLLDIDHGNYPFVTSSSPTVGGAITGLGIGPSHIEKVIGVVKAYSTRVGEGPFPTELFDENADRLRGTGANPWDEYGTTTGRPRRCGWLDMMVVNYAARINGLTELSITKLDILSGFAQVDVANRYFINGDEINTLPDDPGIFAQCQPVYESLPGWSEDIMGITAFNDLPAQAQNYVKYIEKLTSLPVNIITVGPARGQTIWQ